MTNPLRSFPLTRPRGVTLAATFAAMAITAAIVAAVGAGMTMPGERALARHAPPDAVRFATRDDAAPIEVTIHPSSVHVVGIVVERTAAERAARARG